jgi:regulator of sigma E protease
MTIILVIVGISVLILIHELGHFLAAKIFNVKVEEFGFGFPPRIVSKKIGETRYSLNLLPFGGFVRLLGEAPDAPVSAEERRRSFSHQSAYRRILIIVAGVLMNFLLGWLIISAVFMVGVPKSIVVTNVLTDSPAASAGMAAGDQIIGFENADEFVNFVRENQGRPIALEIKRGGEDLVLEATPRLSPPEGQGALGIAFSEAGFKKQPILAALVEGWKTSIAIVGAIFTGLFQLLATLFTQGKLAAGFVGPVGIFGVAAQTADLGLVYLLQLLGLISLNLFVLNIFPFPALDGGRLLFVIIEKIKGSPLSPNFEKAANALGFFILLLLMLALTVRDVAQLF